MNRVRLVQCRSGADAMNRVPTPGRFFTLKEGELHGVEAKELAADISDDETAG